jgi:hypothetical protein
MAERRFEGSYPQQPTLSLVLSALAVPTAQIRRDFACYPGITNSLTAEDTEMFVQSLLGSIPHLRSGSASLSFRTACVAFHPPLYSLQRLDSPINQFRPPLVYSMAASLQLPPQFNSPFTPLGLQRRLR